MNFIYLKGNWSNILYILVTVLMRFLSFLLTVELEDLVVGLCEAVMGAKKVLAVCPGRFVLNCSKM